MLPNYRTAEMSADVQPLTVKQKLRIATKDSFDYPLIFIGAAYAGLYQMENNHPEFGQGMKGYADRFGTSYADQVIGNFMTEGFMPILLHEDPRYFRKCRRHEKSRTWYALTPHRCYTDRLRQRDLQLCGSWRQRYRRRNWIIVLPG